MSYTSDKYSFNIRVTGILIEDDKILLVKQKVSDKRNWSLPGGKLERGETLEQALIREMNEETGFDVDIIKLLYVCDVLAAGNTYYIFHSFWSVSVAKLVYRRMNLRIILSTMFSLLI